MIFDGLYAWLLQAALDKPYRSFWLEIGHPDARPDARELRMAVD